MNVVELTRALVERYSPTGDEAPASEFAAGVLERLGLRVVRQTVGPGRFNVFAVGAVPPVVVFATHLDVVPPDLGWAEDDEWIEGRGVVDAKGIAAAEMAALAALRGDGEERVGILFTVGEETDSDGAKAAAVLEPKGRFLVNGEPTENRLSIGQKGVLGFELRAVGRAAHSAYPEEGRSAVDALLAGLARIRAIPLPRDPLLGETTLNIGKIAGGVAANVIPPGASADLLFRTIDDGAALLTAVEQAAGAEVSVRLKSRSPAVRAPALEGWDSVVVRFGSDLPHLADWGVGYQMGPGTIRVAHTDGERIRKAELAAAVDRYVRLARQLIAMDARGKEAP
ncbi:MAG: M20/M25/M40 family metallo-hydrolase [Gemmatimonadales bacterium]